MKKACRNSKCGAATASGWRTGWVLRSGRKADLCDSCGSAYEQMRFCETFHSDEDGWKTCNTCKKHVHCGCMASAHLFVLLDAGGIECIDCAKKSGDIPMASNEIQHIPQVLFPSQRLQDAPVKSWSDGMEGRISGHAFPGQWGQFPNQWQSFIGQAEVSSCRQTPEVEKSNDIELTEFNAGERSSVSDLNRVDDVLHKRQGMECLKMNTLEDSGESSAIPVTEDDMNDSGFVKEEQGRQNLTRVECYAEGVPDSCPQTGMTGFLENLKGEEACVDREILKCSRTDNKALGEPTRACLNISFGYLNPKNAVEGCNNMSTPTLGLAISSGSPGDTKEQSKLPAAYLQHQRQCQILPKPTHASPSTGSESSKDIHPQIRVARPPGEGRGKNQLLPRYWPRTTDKELKQISRDSNSSVTPLFEKMLSASDAGRIGRLVLPKACAEAYFPPISQPEGVPLTVQDAKGKDWVFQFRYWPNNNSRMYVLEGVTACIQAMELQAGDTVTFSRLDREGKLVMGFRKASNSSNSLCPQEGQPCTSAIGNSLGGGFNSGSSENVSCLPLSSTKGNAEFLINAVTEKKRSRNLCAKTKRLHIDNEDAVELKLTWEEAQDLLRPPPRAVPSVVMIEGHEFEEYEEPPVLGKRTIFIAKQSGEQDQWAQCDECCSWRRVPLDVVLPRTWTCANNTWDSKRASCSAPQEISSAELEDLLRLNIDMKKQEAAEGPKGLEKTSGLDALANAVALDENATAPPLIAQTTKHPRHRPGCTCIVCIQPPSGKGPKHKPTCTCNVCMTVKRRFKTLMMRRKKRQSEREVENSRKKRTSVKEEGEVSSVAKGRSDVYPPSDNGSRQANPGLELRDGITPVNKSSGNGIKLPMDLNLQASYKDSKDSRGGSIASKGQIDLNSHPEREEESLVGAGRMSMLRLLQGTNMPPIDVYIKQQGFGGMICPPFVTMPTAGFQNNPTDQRVEHNYVPSMVQNLDHSKEEPFFHPNRIKSDAASVSFQVSHQSI